MTTPAEEGYEVMVRVSVRRVSDGRRVGKDAVGAFDLDRYMEATALGEAAIEAAQLAARGIIRPAAALARARLFVREAARRPDVQRGVSIVSTALRRGAAALELDFARAAATVIHPEMTGEPDE